MTNTELLYKTLDESGVKTKKLIREMGTTYTTFRKKAHNELKFTADDIYVICCVAHIDTKLRDRIFFANYVA